MIPNELVLLLVLISTLAPLLYIEKNKGIFSKSAERHISAKQAVHTMATPRIGGIPVAIGILSGALLSGNNLFSGLLWTTLPIFWLGSLKIYALTHLPCLELVLRLSQHF